MDILEIIRKKNNNEVLEEEEFFYFVNEMIKGNIPKYQIVAFLSSIYYRGLTDDETYYLTMAMAKSGTIFDWGDLDTVDKHSTGGVGDKLTLALTPILASLGFYVPKMSGRSLGLTGGTIDKLESVKGFKTDISVEEFKKNVELNGLSIISQTSDVVPADKILYSLRDELSLTDSIPLIASSIMSKKIAIGAKNLILNVTCGKGAFMKNLQDAKTLSILMKKIAEKAGINCVVIITNMNSPLGRTVGNRLEVNEAVEVLLGAKTMFREFVIDIAEIFLKNNFKDLNSNYVRKIIEEKVDSGRAYKVFKNMMLSQGVLDEELRRLQTKQIENGYTLVVKSREEGYIKDVDAEKIAIVAHKMGAGRNKEEEKINGEVGIELLKKVGDYVRKSDPLALLYIEDVSKLQELGDILFSAYTFSKDDVNIYKEILEII